MLTKDDKKFLLDNFASKKDIDRIDTSIGILKREIKADIAELANALGVLFQWTDDIHRAIIGKPSRKPSEN